MSLLKQRTCEVLEPDYRLLNLRLISYPAHETAITGGERGVTENYSGEGR
jgi:hypothetical protein